MHAALAASATLARIGLLDSPSPQPVVDPALVTPGAWGFVVIAVLAVIVVLLVFDMMRRVRRGRVRADINEELDAEQLAASQADAAVEASDVDDQFTDPDDDRRRR